VNIDNPAALHFIMQDDIFLLKSERELFGKAFEEVAEAAAVAVPVEVKEEAVVVEMVPKKPEPEQAKQAAAIKYRGNNKSGYVILVHYPSLEWMHDAHLSALENTLKRKGIDPADVAIINMAVHGDMAYEEFIIQLKPQKLLLMGKEALPTGIAEVKFNQLHQLPSCTALYTFSFGEMMDSNENKKIFWEQMKAL
jgi:hypothetical protein